MAKRLANGLSCFGGSQGGSQRSLRFLLDTYVTKYGWEVNSDW